MNRATRRKYGPESERKVATYNYTEQQIRDLVAGGTRGMVGNDRTTM